MKVEDLILGTHYVFKRGDVIQLGIFQGGTNILRFGCVRSKNMYMCGDEDHKLEDSYLAEDVRILTSKDIKNLYFRVQAYRWGEIDNHNYTVGVCTSIKKALVMKDDEEEGRGGKYNCAIYPFFPIKKERKKLKPDLNKNTAWENLK